MQPTVFWQSYPPPFSRKSKIAGVNLVSQSLYLATDDAVVEPVGALLVGQPVLEACLRMQRNAVHASN